MNRNTSKTNSTGAPAGRKNVTVRSDRYELPKIGRNYAGSAELFLRRVRQVERNRQQEAVPINQRPAYLQCAQRNK